MTLRIPAASVFVAPIILSAVVVARGQSATAPPEASAKRLTFEVASIKRNVSADAGGSVRVEPGNRLIVTNIPLAGLVRHAHGTQRWEMLPGGDLPSWMQTERWDIRAMAAADATPAQVNDMFKNLLADRFKLVARREARQIPVYNLVRARADGRLGPQLRVSASDCSAARAATPSCGATDSPGRITFEGAPWIRFPTVLSLAAGRFIVDKTGITGPVDLQLTYATDQPGGVQSESPSLFAALSDQLGLRLEPSQALVEVLVVFSAERPTED